MKVKLTAVLLLTATVFLLCSCSATYTDTPVTSDGEPTEAVTEATETTEAAKSEPEVTFKNYTADPPEKWSDSVYTEYDRLNIIRKNIYAELYDGITSGNNNFRFRGVAAVSQDSVFNAFNAMIVDHPELFYINKSYFFRKGRDKYGEYLDFVCNLNTDENIPVKRKNLKKIADKVMFEASELETDFAKAQYVHDYLIMNCSYDFDAADRITEAVDNNKIPNETASTAYGCLVEGKAVCSGYTDAYQLIMQRLGIPCGKVTGTVNGVGHIWNWIKLDGDYYYVDVTNDDVNYDKIDQGIILYEYFCVTEEMLLLTHEYREDVYDYFIPECVSADYNPFVKNGLYFETYDPQAVKSAVDSFYSNASRIDIRFENAEACEEAKKDLFDNGRIWEYECVSFENAFYITGLSKTYICILLY